jgi:uncharacterized protein
MNLFKAEEFIVQKLREELPESLSYHGLHHTLDVVESALRIAQAEGVSDEETLALLRTAALFHDAGFLSTYQGHEAEGCRLVREVLPGFEFSPQQIATVCGMIEATEIPQSPKNLLEEIICDADLDYLGRDDFETIASSLFREMQVRNFVADEATWDQIQIQFIGNHRYWTHYSQTTRQPIKQRHLQQLKKKLPQD